MEKKKSARVDGDKNVSKSKAKRDARRKQVQREKRDANVAKITGSAVAAIIVLGILFVVGRQLYIMAIRTTPSTDYSAALTDDGRIADADMAAMVGLADYGNISVPTDRKSVV